ncbi:MAG: hypothetical protein GY913_06210 [Proteobacteria bacterium]|nr:hypothetical protein [Pseudomonadota bacterium]
MLLLMACFPEEPAIGVTPPSEPIKQIAEAPAQPTGSTSPDPLDAPDPSELDMTRPEPFAAGEGTVPVPVEDRLSAIKRACVRLEDCGCNDDQPYERCVSSAHGTTLPDTVYRCIASRPCEALCEPNAQGTADKGLTDCVKPYIDKTIANKGTGLKKRADK